MDTETPREKLTWSELEYEDRERSRDWFWALGIIVVTSSVASIIFGDYFFAALLILSGVLLGFFAIRKPEMVEYELNGDGLKIANNIHLYKDIKSFWVQTKDKPLLFIHSDRIFMPVMVVPIQWNMAEDIHSIMLSQNILEKEMKEHPSEKIMEFLGF